MTADDAEDLADLINEDPAWEADAFIGAWPSKVEPGKYTGGWIVACGRKGDDRGYMLKSPVEWPMLVRMLNEGEETAC